MMNLDHESHLGGTLGPVYLEDYLCLAVWPDILSTWTCQRTPVNIYLLHLHMSSALEDCLA